VFIGPGNSLNYAVTKKAAFPVQSISFTSAELIAALGSYSSGNINFYAFNYSRQTVEGLSYAYELSAHTSKFVYVTQ
jgi:hypothetical protein